MLKASTTRRDHGFTLIELMMVITLFGILAAFGVMPLKNYQRTQEHVGAARDVVAALRNAQVRAVSEGTTYKVSFDANRVRVYRGDAGVYTLARGYDLPTRVTLASVAPGFTPATTTSAPTPTPGADAFFYGRGTASAGTLRLTRAGSSKTYTISIEGLTARVSLS